MNALVATCEGQFVKAFPANQGPGVYGFHSAFGLVSEDTSLSRRQAARRKGVIGEGKNWEWRFRVVWENGVPKLEALENCKVESRDNAWWIQTANKSWKLSTGFDAKALPLIPAVEVETETHERVIAAATLLLFLLLIGIIAFWQAEKVEAPKEPEIAPITVVVRPPQVVHVGESAAVQKLPPQVKANRAVMQNLGFLGLVGRKDLKKAVGGAQIKLNASPGAGAGGNAGSGGEVLSGLGQGVRATTVGNTGVQGLGGVGTKGAGGGLGGYGDVNIASGEGRGISAVSVSQGVGVDGGLDRHVIQATIAKYLSQVRACYEDRLRVNPGLAGTLTMDFEIGPQGRLNFARPKSSSVGDPLVGSCVSQRMMGWEFPKPRGGVNVKVNYPFNLRPVGR